MMRIRILSNCLFALLSSSTLAQARDQATLATVRELAKEGLRAYDEGRYEEAAAKSRMAYEVVRLPTLALNRARALAKLGKLIAASEMYLEAARLERLDTWQPIQQDAQHAAERERDELLPVIPRMSVSIKNADPERIALTLDGEEIPAALVESEHMVDPGTHIVVAQSEAETQQQTIDVQRGERRSVTLRFRAQPLSSAFKAATPTPKPHAPTALAAGAARTDGPSSTLGWVALGIGGVGLVFGTVEGLAAKSKRDAILASKLCADDTQHCDPSLTQSIDSYQTMRTLSTVGFVSGGLLAVSGMTLLLWPKSTTNQPRVGVRVTSGSVALWGTMQ